MAGVGLVRLGKELKMLTDEPPPGVCAWPVDDCLTHLQAQIQGPEDTPYERGTFLLDLQIPDRYPFEPPKVRFVTPIYHPNIDSGGRICLDTLKMRPAGSWAPSMNVPTLLTTIRLLMAHPNGDDGLMPDITELYLKNPARFADVARAHVEQYARQDASKKVKAPPEGPAADATPEAEQVPGGAAASIAAKTSDSCPTSTDETLGNLAPEEKEGGGKIEEGSAAVAATEATVLANKAISNSADEGATKAWPENNENFAAGAATAAVDLGKGKAAGAGAGAGKEDPETGARRSGANNRNLGGVNGSGEGEGSSGSDRVAGGKVASDGDRASSDDGAWSDSDEDNDDDVGLPGAKRSRMVP